MIKLIKKIYHKLFSPYTLNLEALKRMGLKVGDNVKIMGGVKIDYGHCKHISIGNNVTIAPDVYLLAHDASMYNVKKYTRIGKIIIGDNVFIGLRSVVMPNVRIGENSIIGAGSLVNKSIPKNVVAVGNPIKIICSVEDFYKKIDAELDLYPKFEEGFSERSISSLKEREKKSDYMNDKMNLGIGYIR